MPLRRHLRRAVPAGALLATALAAPAASAQSVTVLPLRNAPSGSATPAKTIKNAAGAPAELDGRLAELAKPSVRSAPAPVKAQILGLPASGPGSLVQDGADVVVRVRMTSITDRRLSALRAAGGRVVGVSSDLGLATVSVAPAALESLAEVAGVEGVSPEHAPLTSQFETSAECQGSVTSEADTQLRAAEARRAFGVTGAGVTVGVISDTFDGGPGSAAQDISTGDLPGPANPCGRTTPVNVLTDAAGTDEGRAMAQVVHDLAPDASLAFATAGNSELEMAQHIADLANAGADVIVDDMTFFDEPFFQESIISDAANQVAAAGIPYFSSAANNNILDGGGQERSSYEAAAYRSMSCPAVVATAAGAGHDTCMDFNPGAGTSNMQTFTVANGGTIRFDFQWAEPWFGVTTDLDLFLLNSAGTSIITSARQDNPGVSQTPLEILSHTNNTGADETVNLVINRYAGAASPRLKWTLLRPRFNVVGIPAVTAPDTFGPSIFGHNGGEQTMSVAAVPFDNSAQVEDFSSRGPVTHYFGPVRGNTPAAPLSAPRTLVKPDIAATDGALTTFFGSGGRFYGTSEAAPHAAAVAALQKQFAPNATVAQIQSAQRNTAAAVGGFGSAARGGGLLNAVGAVGALAPAPTTPPTTPPVTPPPPSVPITPAAKTLASVKADRCKLTGRGRTLHLKCRLRDSDALLSATAKIKKGRRTVATGKAKLSPGALSVRLKRKLRKGTYTFTLTLRGAGDTKRTLNVKLRI